MGEFCNILKQLRQNKGITQKELSKILGISQAAYSLYEKGQREPRYEMLEKIADFFNVSVGYLVSGEKDCIYYKKDISTEWENTIQTLSKYLENTPEFKQHEEMLKETLVEVFEKQQREYETAKRFAAYGFPDANLIKKISDPYLKLNKKGQEKAIEQVELLTKIPEYRKEDK